LFLRVALTGGIATGKSHCLTRFAELGVPVIDADVLAHDVIRPTGPAVAAVTARFGKSVVGRSGEIDRQALGRIVFSDEAARKDLEAIIHPLVYEAIAEWFERQHRRHGFAVADIPLLFETGHESDFDRIIVTTCTPEEQISRLRARGLTDSDARQRIASQLPVAEKAARGDFRIDTSGPVEETNDQLVEVWEKLKAEANALRLNDGG
jgi:dephospho-CoA kinase